MKEQQILHVILIAVFLVLVLVMAADLLLGMTEAMIFYVMAMAVLCVRLSGVNVFTIIIHATAYVYLITVLIFLYVMKKSLVGHHSLLWVIISLILVFLFSLHMMIFRPGQSYNEKALRASIHALFGILLVILIFWICCFTVVTTFVHTLLQCVFLLLFLFIILTPHFQTESHASNVAQYGPPCEKECVGVNAPKRKI